MAAVRYRLPIREVSIQDDGSGNTRRFGLTECERWTVVTYAGPEAEFDLFQDHRGDAGDLATINNMMHRLGVGRERAQAARAAPCRKAASRARAL